LNWRIAVSPSPVNDVLHIAASAMNWDKSKEKRRSFCDCRTAAPDAMRGCGRQFASKGLRCCIVACERQLHERNANTAILAEVGMELNKKLSERRAAMIKQYLVENFHLSAGKRPRLRARTGVQIDVDRRLHDPRQHIEARQSLSKRWSRSGHSSGTPAQIFRLRPIRRAAEEKC
jgi:hypothetical protein